MEKQHCWKSHRPQVREKAAIWVRRNSISSWRSLSLSFRSIQRNISTMASHASLSAKSCCTLYMAFVLAHKSPKPVKVLWHLKTKHPSFTAKPEDFFHRKERELQGQKNILTKQTALPARTQKASYEVAYLIALA